MIQDSQTCALEAEIREVPPPDLMDLYRAHLRTHPLCPEALLGLSVLAPPGHDEMDEQKLLDLVENDKTPAAAAVALSFAYANSLHWQGRFDAAFTAYRSANQRQRQLLPTYDLSAFEAKMIALRQELTAQTLEAARSWGAESRIPLFVAGLPRSGKSTLEGLLTGQPDIHPAGETRRLQDAAYKLDAAMARPAEKEAGRQLQRGFVDELARAYLAALRECAPQARHIVDTNANNVFLLGFAGLLFPQAPIILCRRSLADVGLSCYATRFQSQAYSTDLSHIGRFLRLGHDQAAHWRRVLVNPLLVIEFDELISAPQHVRAKVMAFLDLQAEAETTFTISGIFHSSNDYKPHLAPLYQALSPAWKAR